MIPSDDCGYNYHPLLEILPYTDTRSKIPPRKNMDCIYTSVHTTGVIHVKREWEQSFDSKMVSQAEKAIKKSMK